MATKRERDIANANAKSAEAAARAAEAQARAIEATNAGAAAARKSDNFLRDTAVSLGVNVALPIAGMAAGAKLAKGIATRHAAHIKANNKELASLASGMTKVMRGAVPKNMTPAAALAGGVAAADKLKLARAAGPSAVAYAGIILAEGAMSRFVVAPSLKSETAQEVMSGVGTASAFMASTLVGKRMIDNATSKVVPNAANLAIIDGARAKLLTTKGGTAALNAATIATRPAMTAGRLALRALPIIGNVAMAAGAGLSAYRAYKEGGTARDIAVSAFRGTIGLGHTVSQARENRMTSSRAALTRAAAARSANSASGVSAMASARRVAAAKPSGDGMTSGYVRQQGGKNVTVKGYRTPR